MIGMIVISWDDVMMMDGDLVKKAGFVWLRGMFCQALLVGIETFT